MAHWDRRELNKLVAESPEEYKKRFPEPFSAMIPEDASSENKLATEAYVNEHGGAEAVKYTEQTLTAEQKAQALANIGAASEGDVSALADQKYEGPYATDGDLPAASASTMGAIYLVGPDANDEYDRKVTKLSGGTYSWASLGKTAIDLANYATKTQVNQLRKDMTDIVTDTMEESPSVNLYDKSQGLLNGYINTSGTISPSGDSYKYSKPTPVTPGHYYLLSGRASMASTGYIRCLDASNNPMKVRVASTGLEHSSWLLPTEDGTGNASNGEFLVPEGAVSVQFNVRWNSQGNDDTVMLIDLGEQAVENPDIPEYVGFRNVYSIKGLQDIAEKAGRLDEEINGEIVPKTSTIAYNAVGKYINGANTNGDIYSYAVLSLAYFPIKSGIRYHIVVEKTNNSAAYELGYATNADGSSRVQVLSDYGKGTWARAEYDLLSTFTGYLAVGYATDSQLPVVTYTEIEGGLLTRIDAIEENVIAPPIKKSIMFFGDSLTSASTTGVDGFAKRIASWLNLPYRSFVLDSNDGNTADVPVDYTCFTNYAKDGTRNRVTSSRPKPDSVIERVKRHITADTNVQIVLVECCVNDMADADAKGQISASYTADYDLETTLGAIEETCRYLTTLGKPLRVGFYIPWKITWGNPSFFDDHILVFKKWGIPYLDLRETAGFDMRDCVAHRIYSLTAENVPNYDATATYNTDDMVKYGGMLYKCKNDNVTGIVPTNKDYWIEMPGGSHDGTHLNNLGHEVVEGKIRAFLESL